MISAPIADLAERDRLEVELDFLRDVMDANRRWGRAYEPWAAERAQAEAFRLWDVAVAGGVSEWDAEHPCLAIEAREEALRLLTPDRVLREMGVPALPGMPT